MNRPRRIAAFLFLGAASSIAVAWSVSLRTHIIADDFNRYPWTEYAAWTRRPGTAQYTQIIINRRHGVTVAMTRIVTIVAQSFHDNGLSFDDLADRTPRWARDFVWPWPRGRVPWPADKAHDWRVAAGFGWPMRCVWLGYAPGQSVFLPSATLGGWTISPPPSSTGAPEYPRAIPYRIAWPGLIGNTLLYAAAWGSLISGVRAMRRSIRRRRGCCAACGYDLRGMAGGGVCPECGAEQATTNPEPPTGAAVIPGNRDSQPCA